jgi:N6-L-threonylcarbamoyladenine synthase
MTNFVPLLHRTVSLPILSKNGEFKSMNILGIETSCDETSVSILCDGRIIVNEIHSQDIHAHFGGVVPEMASRAHLGKIDALCASVFQKSGLLPNRIDAIAVTDCPGLAGALLVGISFALGLHCGQGTPVTGINHLEGHISSIFLENPALGYPFLALIVSGGHTSIYKVEDFGRYVCLGKTVDDAAGEAFDKIGKMLGFNYPAGRAIEEEALKAPELKPIPFPIARAPGPLLDFSFSGLKTSVKYFLRDHEPGYGAENKPLLCKSFQNAIVESLVANVKSAVEQTGISTIAVVGGVACNALLRRRMRELAGCSVYFPSPTLCTDNAAMIARAGFERVKRKITRPPRLGPSTTL